MKIDVNLKNISGIYQIKNIVNGKLYVGRAKCFYSRGHQHKYDFKNRSTNSYLKRAYLKYGLDSFSFEPLEICQLNDTPQREQYWIEKLQTTNRRKGYNLRTDVEGCMIASDITKNKISKRLKNEWKSGIRRNHALKLAANWKDNAHRKTLQSAVMSKTLTKYAYLVNGQIMNHKDLKSNKLGNVLYKFHKYQTDVVIFKGQQITRSLI